MLLTYITNLQPKELADFYEDYLWTLVRDLPTPKKWNHAPKLKARKDMSSFCGIDNLSSICYMISMIQQFYMVPQFRYLILRAENKKDPDIKEWRDTKIDDNLLLQV